MSVSVSQIEMLLSELKQHMSSRAMASFLLAKCMCFLTLAVVLVVQTSIKDAIKNFVSFSPPLCYVSESPQHGGLMDTQQQKYLLFVGFGIQKCVRTNLIPRILVLT
jgi:hypothetical protein